LTTTKTTLNTNESATLTATANQSMNNSGYYLSIFDQTTGNRVCTTTSYATIGCNVGWSQNPHTYIAYVANGATTAPPADVQATSNTVTLSPAAFTVTLTTTKTMLNTNESATLTATANQSMTTSSGLYLSIFDQTTGNRVCYTTSSSTTGCNVGWKQIPHTYIAYVANGATTAPPADIQASSNTATVSPAAFTVTLTTTKTSLSTGQSATLTATANQSMTISSGLYLSIFDQTTGNRVCYTTSSSTTGCNVSWHQTPHTYIAYVGGGATTPPPADIQATSNRVTIFPGPISVTLTTPEARVGVGVTTTLTATASQGVGGTADDLSIFDQTTGDRVCFASTGSTLECTVTGQGDPHTFVAYVSDPGTTDPPSNIAATSNTVTIYPPPSGSISITVNSWDRDPESGDVTYDFDVSFEGADQFQGPCDGSCSLFVEGLDVDGVVQQTFLGGGSYDNVSSDSLAFTTVSASLPAISALQARLAPSGGSRDAYTTLRFVGDHVQADNDMVPYEIALVAFVNSPSALCASLTAAGGMFPSTQGMTTSDVVNACSEAAAAPGATLRKVIVAIALATGGIGALQWLVDEEENVDDVPAPKPGVDPAPTPMQPPPDWDDQGCEPTIIGIEEAVAGPKIGAHLWGAGEGKSEFYPWAGQTLSWLAKYAEATELPVPSLGRCERVVSYPEAYVGIIRLTPWSGPSGGEPTNTYTVITEMDGSLFNMYPGTLDE
jgi:hypothetical protein